MSLLASIDNNLDTKGQRFQSNLKFINRYHGFNPQICSCWLTRTKWGKREEASVRTPHQREQQFESTVWQTHYWVVKPLVRSCVSTTSPPWCGMLIYKNVTSIKKNMVLVWIYVESGWIYVFYCCYFTTMWFVLFHYYVDCTSSVCLECMMEGGMHCQCL